jgi:hypothetical protein
MNETALADIWRSGNGSVKVSGVELGDLVSSSATSSGSTSSSITSKSNSANNYLTTTSQSSSLLSSGNSSKTFINPVIGPSNIRSRVSSDYY